LLVKLLLKIHQSSTFLYTHYLLLVVILENGLSSCSSSVSRPCCVSELSNDEANSQATIPFAIVTSCARGLFFEHVFSLFSQGSKVTGTSCPISFFTCAAHRDGQHVRTRCV
jgi:hypothetical protein